MNNIKNEILILKSDFLKLNKLIKENMVIDDKVVENENLLYIEKGIEELLNGIN